jgi:hypothetical protein
VCRERYNSDLRPGYLWMKATTDWIDALPRDLDPDHVQGGSTHNEKRSLGPGDSRRTTNEPISSEAIWQVCPHLWQPNWGK